MDREECAQVCNRAQPQHGCAEPCLHPVEKPLLSKVQQDPESKASQRSTEQRVFLQSTAFRLPGEREGAEASLQWEFMKQLLIVVSQK